MTKSAKRHAQASNVKVLRPDTVAILRYHKGEKAGGRVACLFCDERVPPTSDVWKYFSGRWTPIGWVCLDCVDAFVQDGTFAGENASFRRTIDNKGLIIEPPE